MAMEWIEANPLPPACQNCQEEECYNCDYAGERWVLSKEDELRLQKVSLLKAIDRLQQQVKKIDEELKALADKSSANSL